MWTQTWPYCSDQKARQKSKKYRREEWRKPPSGFDTNSLHVKEVWRKRSYVCENEYKNIKIKEAVKLYSIADPTMAAVRSFEELAVQKGCHSIIKDVTKYADELGLQLQLIFPNPAVIADGNKVEATKAKLIINKARQQKMQSTVSLEKWQGKLIKNRWDDEKAKPEKCFLAQVMEKRTNAYYSGTTYILPAAVTHQDIPLPEDKNSSY